MSEITDPARPAFGRRMRPAALPDPDPTPSPDRLPDPLPAPGVLARVSEGSDVDLFGLSPGVRRVLAIGSGLSLALWFLWLSLAPTLGHRMARQFEAEFAEGLRREAMRQDAPIHPGFPARPEPGHAPDAFETDRCAMGAYYGPGAGAGLVERANWQFQTAVLSLRDWLSFGRGPLPKSRFQETVDRLGGVPCFPASPNAPPLR